MSKLIKHKSELVSQIVAPKGRLSFDAVFTDELVKVNPKQFATTCNFEPGGKSESIAKLMRVMNKERRREMLAPLYNSTAIAAPPSKEERRYWAVR